MCSIADWTFATQGAAMKSHQNNYKSPTSHKDLDNSLYPKTLTMMEHQNSLNSGRWPEQWVQSTFVMSTTVWCLFEDKHQNVASSVPKGCKDYGNSFPLTPFQHWASNVPFLKQKMTANSKTCKPLKHTGDFKCLFWSCRQYEMKININVSYASCTKTLNTLITSDGIKALQTKKKAFPKWNV